MTTIVTRAGKGSAITNSEMDGNLTGLIANNSGAAEPTTIYAYQWWADTTTGILKQRNAANSAWINILTMSTGAPLATSLGEQSLTAFYSCASGSGYQDLYRAGFMPAWFNQQWGGAQWGMLPDGSLGSVATGQIQDDTNGAFGYDATLYYVAQSFTLSEAMTSPTIWVKLMKTGDPAGTAVMYVYSSTTQVISTAKPNAQIGGAGQVSGKLITSKVDGEWYAFTPTPGALSANTIYHIVLSSSAPSTTNYFRAKETTAAKYPLGALVTGTSAPVWTVSTTGAINFLIQNPAANSVLQSGGMFDYKLAFNPGTPVNQSRAHNAALANFYDGITASVLHRGTYAVSTNVCDYLYGIDHDRFTLTINASGYPVLTIYRQDRTAYTITGTGSVTSGNHDVGFRLRTAGDGADYATLYVDGVSVGTPLTAQTFTMDVNFAKLGNFHLGDGFGLAPTFTGNAMTNTAALPSDASNGSWTFTGGGTESTYFSMQGGKLYQNYGGFASGDSKYYAKASAWAGGQNTTGWTTSWKVRVPSSPNTTYVSSTGAGGAVWFRVIDGTKLIDIVINEYFLSISGTALGTVDAVIQGDFKSQEHVFTLCGQLSNVYLFIDGKLAYDGTGKLLIANAGNTINFGDQSTTASENADAIWSYVKYYQGGMILPVANTGSCSEFAHWSGDKSALFPSLWNSGTPVSVKQLCGVPRNYQYEAVVQREVRRGVTSIPTTSSTTPVVLTDMEAYVIGSAIDSDTGANLYNATTALDQLSLGITTDGIFADYYGGFRSSGQDVASSKTPVEASLRGVTVSLGLHKIESRWKCTSGTNAAVSTTRSLDVKARS